LHVLLIRLPFLLIRTFLGILTYFFYSFGEIYSESLANNALYSLIPFYEGIQREAVLHAGFFVNILQIVPDCSD